MSPSEGSSPRDWNAPGFPPVCEWIHPCPPGWNAAQHITLFFVPTPHYASSRHRWTGCLKPPALSFFPRHCPHPSEHFPISDANFSLLPLPPSLHYSHAPPFPNPPLIICP